MAKFSREGGAVEHKKPGLIKKIEKSFEETPDIAIGFPRGKAASIQYPDGTPLIDVAVYNNYGTFNEDGSIHIPPRPFMDIGGVQAVNQTRQMRLALWKKVRSGEISAEDAAEIIGSKASAIMKNTIRDFDDPPNAPSTIARKKSSNPLVDTGLLMQSVTWDVRKKKKTV